MVDASEAGPLSDEQFSRGSATFRERLREPGLRAYWLKQRGPMTKAAPRYYAFAGSQGGFAGLDQANVLLPASFAGKGNVTIQLTANGLAANPVNITIQ